MFYLVTILFGVGWMLASVIRNYSNKRSPISHKYLNHGTLIELIWTITPAIILILIAFPSFKLLYLMDEVADPAMSILAEGLDGPKSYIFNNIENINCLIFSLRCKINNIMFIQSKNFSNNSMFHTRVKAANRIGPHHEDVISVIVGSLLNFRFNVHHSTFLSFTLTLRNKSHIETDYTYLNNNVTNYAITSINHFLIIFYPF